MDEIQEDEAVEITAGRRGDSQVYARALFTLLNTVLADISPADNDLTEEAAYLLSIEIREQLRLIARSIAQIPIVLR